VSAETPKRSLALCSYNDSNAVYYYHYDALGSVVALSDADGDTVQLYEYSVFGQVAASAPNHTNPFLFTGRRYDTETGLYYYRAHDYNPYIGRFLQTDPIGYAAGPNLYAYCGNNSLNLSDPFGLDPCDPCDGDNDPCGPYAYVYDPGSGDLLELTGDWNSAGLCNYFNIVPEGVISFLDDGSAPFYVLDRENYGYQRYWPENWMEPGAVKWGEANALYHSEEATEADAAGPPLQETGSEVGASPELESPWSVFADAYSQACYGVLNTILGGLFKTEAGIPYMVSSTVKEWAEGEAFKGGETGWRVAEVALVTAAGVKVLGADQWLGTAGIHPPHHGMGYHFEIIIRGPSGKNLTVIVPGAEDWIFIGLK
jgi:RHS repeat-associated protein